jgi:hypothetical protein
MPFGASVRHGDHPFMCFMQIAGDIHATKDDSVLSKNSDPISQLAYKRK